MWSSALRRGFGAAGLAATAGIVRAHEQLTACDEAPSPRVVGAIVLFRHGARSPVFSLPDSPNEPGDSPYNTLDCAPAHAVPVTVLGTKNGAVPNWGPGGRLTAVGWAQGEALGRELKKRYGAPSVAPVTSSTAVSRTVLTAHAVLTGLYTPQEGIPAAAGDLPAGGPSLPIHIESYGVLFPPTTCAALSDLMATGRRAHREGDAARLRAQERAADAYGEDYNASSCTMIAIHDDCVSRRFEGHPPSKEVSSAFCETIDAIDHPS